ncbi:MAG: MEDS domain-containing protein [Nitrososphaerota archaeon]
MVDSDPDVLNLFGGYLGANGLLTVLRGTGSDCLDEVKKRKKRFDIVILDTDLYDMKGVEVAKKILELNPDQKIIMTTTSSTYSLERELKSLEIGLQNILLKPFRLFQLLSTVRHAISRINNIGLRDHVLASYQSLTDEIQDAVQFLKNGIKNNECVMVVGRRDFGFDEIAEAFTTNGIDVGKLMSNNSLMVIDSKEWYIPDEKFDKHRIIDQWNDLVSRSIVIGKKGLRTFCMMDTFFEHNYVEELVDYESELPRRFDIPFLAICAYKQSDLDKLSNSQRARMVKCHNPVWIQN